jgi:hypothetical protein
VILSRYAYFESATLGRLTIRGREHALRTVEPGWLPGPARGGTPFVSCVPDGLYSLARRTRANGDTCLLLRNPALGIYGEQAEVPATGGRALVELHSANYARELKGCVAPGLQLVVGVGADFGDSAMITSSRVAVQFVLEAFDAGDRELQIVSALGASDPT